MKHIAEDCGSNSNRRNFLKMIAVTLFGSLAACVPGLSNKTDTPSAPPSATAGQVDSGSLGSSQPSTATAAPSETPLPSATVSPEATTSSTATSPTACPPDVECDQAMLSGINNRAEGAQLFQRRILNPNPTHIITSLCLRDGGCVEVCPVECIVPGRPQSKWPRYYIDPDTCIDCGACIPECPYSAIYREDEVPSQYIARGGEYINRSGICGHYKGINHHGETIMIDTACRLTKGQMVDLTVDIEDNYQFFYSGPGYEALSG